MESTTSSLYDSLKESGYDLFNESDPFYNDICSVYTSKKGTDMTLDDRKQEIYGLAGNISLCQSGCELEYYNSTNKKAKCECSPQIEETKPVLSSSNNKYSIKKLAECFLKTLKNSNFLVLKCYKLAINLESILENKGRILMTIILFLSFICFIIFRFTHNKKIYKIIKSILTYKLNMDNNNKSKINNEINIYKIKKANKEINNKNNNNKNKIQKNNKDKNLSKIKNNKLKKNNEKVVPPKKNRLSFNTKQKSVNNKNDTKQYLLNNIFNKRVDKTSKSNINIVKIENINFNDIKENNHKDLSKNNKNNKISGKKGPLLYYQSNDNIFNINSKNNTKKKINNNIKYENLNLNDQELNNLEYQLAILIDKRTYFQYYWSLLKKKHLILFTFFPSKDYTLISIKLGLFLFSFSLYITINGFFFSVDTIHKIHEDNGDLNFIYQIPQILYSTVITAVITIILKQLSLSENNILSIKQQKDFNRMKKKSKKIKRCLLIKFIIYFILISLLLIFFWYFISCFCAFIKILK